MVKAELDKLNQPEKEETEKAQNPQILNTTTKIARHFRGLQSLLQAVLVAAVPVCAAFIGKGLKALASYLGKKSENETAKKYLAEAAEAISTAVTFTSQTYVDALKKSGQFDKAAQEWALEVALAQAQRMLTEEAKEFLAEAYGDLGKYLEGRIETEVRNQKLGFGTLTLSA